MQKDKIKMAFWGTGEVSGKTLEMLLQCGYKPEVVITSRDKRSGRGMHLNESYTSLISKKYNIKCIKPEKIDSAFLSEFSNYNVDISIVVAYGKILTEDVINKPKFGTLNIHYSLLPKYRGASPLEASLLNGDESTGVSIQKMVFKLDSGPILSEEKIKIDINDTKEDLRKKLIELGALNLCKVLEKIQNGNLDGKKQNEDMATYCKKIKKEDGLLDIINGNPKENWNKYRAYLGWPNTFFFVNKKGKKVRVKITKAKYENDSFEIERVIPEGKKEISYKDFIKN